MMSKPEAKITIEMTLFVMSLSEDTKTLVKGMRDALEVLIPKEESQ